MNLKTALILCTAGGVVAAATALTHTTQAGDQTPPPAAPVVAADSTSQTDARCGGPAQPADHRIDFASGTLSAALSSGKLLTGSKADVFLSVALDAHTRAAVERPSLSLALVIDRSGSMQGDSLVQAKRAAIGIVDRLSARDQVAVVQYDDTADVIFPTTSMDATGKALARQQISGIVDSGSTNLHDGLAQGRDQVLRSSPGSLRRVILLSDGIANAGITHEPTLHRVAGAAADQGVRITTVGLGVDYNEDLMEALAEHGRGRYYYVKDATDLDTVFRGEFAAMQATVATGAEIRLTPRCPEVEIAHVYGYHNTRDGADTVIPMADLFGGDARKLVIRLRVPADRAGAMGIIDVALTYTDATSKEQHRETLALGVEITGDAQAVERSANKAVIAQSVEVESARAMRDAAAAYQAGNRAEANRINRDWRTRAQEQAANYHLSDDDMEEVYQELDTQAADMRQLDPTSGAGKAMIKGSKAKARMFSKQRK